MSRTSNTTATDPGAAAAQSTAKSEAAATESTKPDPAKIERADATRIGTMLGQIAEIGADGTGGISRISFTRVERDAHELVGGWLKELGLTVRVDAIGNTIAERPGTIAGAPAIGIGSHLDSVPHGGRYDGIVGVVGAVEAIRLLNQHDVRTRHPVRVVIFAGEEGARFGEPCVGSKFVTGALGSPDLDRMRDAAGTSLAQALRAIGFEPRQVEQARWKPKDWAAFLELHIEQARMLELDGAPIGLVDVVSGSTRLLLEIQGRADHSGGTPMAIRADALTAAAEIVLHAEGLARNARNRGARLTVGRLDVHPNSITTIPGRVRLTIDVRDVDSDRQRSLVSEVVQHARDTAERRGVSVEVERIADTSPAVLPIWVRQLTSQVCEQIGLRYRVMTSGAGHDSQVINQITDAGLIFVPSREGLSHVPEEWTSASEIARGVDVLWQSIGRLDETLAAETDQPSG